MNLDKYIPMFHESITEFILDRYNVDVNCKIDVVNFTKICVTCGKIIQYRSFGSLLSTLSRKVLECQSCSLVGRKFSQEHKKKIGLGNKGKRKGKTHIEIFGKEKTDQIREKRNKKLTGRKRPPFSEEWIDNMIKSRKDPNSNYQKWMKSDEYRQKRRIIAIKYNTGLDYDEWLEKRDDKEKYYHEVRKYTLKQPIHLLENHEKRGNSDTAGAYHLDHIIPKIYGFYHDITPEEIGNISNLQFIPWRENLRKGSRLIK